MGKRNEVAPSNAKTGIKSIDANPILYENQGTEDELLHYESQANNEKFGEDVRDDIAQLNT